MLTVHRQVQHPATVHRIKSFYTVSILLLLSPTLYAQFPTDYQEQSGRTAKQQKTPVEIDTLSPDIYIFQLDNPSNTSLLKDKELHNFHIFDPIRQLEFDHINTGNFGSAAKSIVYQPRFRRGFDAGFHAYDPYAISQEDIVFYKLEKAYSDVAFSQGASQQQTNFAGKFSKNIQPQTNLALDFKRINNQGQYTNQQSKNTAFSINGWYQSTSGQYQAYANYTTNTVQQLENGGVNLTDETGTLSKSVLSVGRPVNTTNGESRYFQRELSYAHYYQLVKRDRDSSTIQLDSLAIRRPNLPNPTGKDSTRLAERKATKRPPSPIRQGSHPSSITPPEGRQYTLFHQLVLRKNTYKYADDLSSGAGNYYGNFVLDDRGVRQYLETRQYENTFSIRTFRSQKNNPLFNRNKGASTKDLIELGMVHTFTDINQEPVDSSLHNAFLFGKIQFTPSEKLKINTYAHLGILKQAGEYYAKGDFLLNLPKIGKVELGLIAQHYSPTLLQKQLYITQLKVWNNNFNKTFENSFSASYYFPLLRLQVKGQLHVLSNYIYFDDQSFARQTAEEITIAQLIVENQVEWKGLHLENQIYFQNTRQEFLRLPTYYSIHRLSYTNTLFKKTLNYQIGAQVRIHAPYVMDGFQPLTAQFHIQNSQRNTYHPNIDIFLNVRIDDFRFFINAQNFYDYFTTDFYYPVFGYPQFDSSIRFGFRWMFLD